MQQKRFENFPAKDDNSKILNFKIERDAPYAYSGDSRPEMPLLPVLEKKQSPLVKFKNAEDLRYQNDYFEIPSPDDFDFENEIFDFEVPKIKPEKSMRMYEPKPQKLIKYAEPLAYMNPLDKYHKETDVEIFEVPAKPYVADKMSYSHFRSSPQFVDIDKSPSPNDYGINPINPRAQLSSKGVMDNSYYTGQGVNGEHFHEKVQDSFRGYQQEEMLEIPKIGLGPGQSFDEHVFTLPDVKFNEDKYKREIEYGRLNGKNFHNSRANDFSSQFSGPAVSKKSNYKPDNRPSYRKETSDYLNYDYNESNEYANYNDVDYNEVDYPNYPPQSPPAKPAPLPPPPGIIEMQHDAVFAGNFDVPKLGVVAEYKPPELIYDEMYQSKDKNSFSNLLPRHPEKHSRSLVVTPTPFLPTPTKPLADYSHLYKQKPYYNQYKTTSKPQKNYFKPQSSPSLTFEPEPYNNDVSRFDDHYDDRQLYEKLHGGNSYNKNFLHEIVENNLDYSEFSNPQIEEEPPMRPETMLPPPSNSYQRAELSLDNEPRFKRYPSVDYTPQDPYSYKPQSIAPAPYPAEPFIPYSDQYSKYTPPPPSPTPAPYYNPQPTQQPDYFKDQLPEFPTPDNFLHEEPDYKTPDYYNAEYYNYNDYRSPSYKSYELDTYDHAEYNDHFNNDHFVDIPKLGVDPGSMFNGPLDPASGNYNQFVNVAAPESFEHGHVRGNPEHKKQEYTRREGRHFKSQVISFLKKKKCKALFTKGSICIILSSYFLSSKIGKLEKNCLFLKTVKLKVEIKEES